LSSANYEVDDGRCLFCDNSELRQIPTGTAPRSGTLEVNTREGDDGMAQMTLTEKIAGNVARSVNPLGLQQMMAQQIATVTKQARFLWAVCHGEESSRALGN